jgi:flagellar hook-associated protein 1 FlgK
MSLLGALDAGATALQVQQASLQVTGNNIANASNPDYDREVANVTEIQPTQYTPTIGIGTGVDLTSVTRQVDEALNSRLNSATSDNSSASTEQSWLTQIESAYNALSGQDVKSQMDSFFSSWSALANDPTDAGARQVVLQDGQSLAGSINSLRSQLGTLQDSVDQQLSTQTQSANGLVQQIAQLNGQIVQAGTGQNNGLLDERDADLKKLSQLMNISTQNEASGSVDVYVGSDQLVEGTSSQGVSLTNQTDSTGNSVPTVTFTQTGGTIPVTSGIIGGLISARSSIVDYSSQVDTLAKNLIQQVNLVHSSGQGTEGYSSVTASNAVQDPTAVLNSAATGLAYTPSNGSFVVTVTDTTTGKTSSTLVPVNLNGGANQTTLNSLATSLGGIAGVNASVSNGKLTIAAAGSNEQISFSQDSSGALAALGINTFFTGDNAANIAVNSILSGDPNLVAAAQNGDSGDNSNAVALSKLGDASVATMNGQSLNQNYQGMVNDIGNASAAATTNTAATQTVMDTLTSQQSSLSGVSLNEEMVNMIQQQNGFQAASRVVTAIDTMMQQVIAMVG